MSIGARRLSALLLLVCLVAVSLPVFASAQINVAAGEDNRCKTICIRAQAQKKPCPTLTREVCTSLGVIGVCMIDGCRGDSYAGLDGKSTGVGDIGGIVGQIFKGLLDKLLAPKPPGGGGGGGGAPPGTTPAGCTRYYTVTVPTSDPCATYVQPTSSSLLGSTNGTQNTASNELLNALSGGSQSSMNTALGADVEGEASVPNVSDQILNQITNQNIGALQTPGANTNPDGTKVLVGGNLANQAVSLKSGTVGNIELRDTGGTVIANARDTQANTEVAGFYGGDTFGTTQSQGVIASMCQSRPWASSVVSFVIPSSFFDSLCAWRGYQVGTPAPPPSTSTVLIQQGVPKQGTPPPPPPPAVSVLPEVDIWAVPAKVTLGGRTSIFWNTKGVASCKETSPDGSFNENTLSGGASTVPLSGATTFSISCLTPDGKPVTDYVTVNLAI